MFRQAFKYMLLTWLIAGLLIVGCVFALRSVKGQTQAQASVTAEVSPSPTATVTPTAVPTATPTPSPTPTPTPEPTPVLSPEEQAVRAYVATMSTEEKLGQMVMFGFSGRRKLDSTYGELFLKYKVGNFLFLSDNIADTSDGGFSAANELITNLTEAQGSDIPLLFAADVEGGTVTRFDWPHGLKSPQRLGELGDTAVAHDQFVTVGQTLKETGILLDLAPVLDVAEEPNKTMFKTRIISSDATVTASIGATIIEALHEGGCMATAKHFPGHGGTVMDSHSVMPVIPSTLEEMESYDLVPFAAAIDAGVDAVMIAHVKYNKLDSSNVATLSYAIITELLREEMGFSGIVISDDFRMESIARYYDAGDAAVRFILAGGDIVLCGPDTERQTAIMEALLIAAQNGTLTEERINESVCRILLKKMAYNGWTPGETSAVATEPTE